MATPRKIIVQKYGGSSLATIEKIHNVAQKICERYKQGYSVVAVVSAMGDTTNELIEMAHSVSPAPGKREMDMLLTAGERISMSLLCMALQEKHVSAISLTGSQSGIITTASHSNARIVEVRPFRVEDALAEGQVAVVAGYQGVSYHREVTTLGRGGSDTTAVALAAALDAEACEIYSDVDGVYTGDPRKVNAVHLPVISYAEMQEMSAAGAQVLNAQAVEFAKQANIILYCRATDDTGKETIVRKGGYPKTTGQITGVASLEHIGRIVLQGTEGMVPLLELLEKHQVPSRQFICNGTGASAKVSLLISINEIPDFNTLNKHLEKIDNMEINTGLGAVSLVGETINETKENLLQALAVLQQHKISWHGIDTTNYRITFLVDNQSVERTVSILHAAFIEETCRA